MELFFQHDRLKASQSFLAPTVYFDHWALCEFSENSELQDQFVEIIKEKKGTFILSHLNLIEFANMDDSRHVKASELFLNRIIPNTYLADFNLEEALKFDTDYPHQTMSLPPDLTALKILADRSIALTSKLSFEGFISLSYEHRNSLRVTFIESIERIANAYKKQKENPEYVKKARLSIPDLHRPKTHVIAGELMRDVILCDESPIKANDIVDLQHATLSVSCCDYVLLDGAWEQRVSNMMKRITKQNIQIKLAKCFSKKNNGIKNFLSDLSRFENSEDKR